MKPQAKTKSKSKVKVSNVLKTGSSAPTDPAANDSFRYFLYFLIITLPVLSAYYYYNAALATNQFLSFPLDDPWIHLQFARNIVEYFSFSYYKNEMTTAGSTSPLYVFSSSL